MCIAVPMEIIEIDEGGNSGTAVFSGNKLHINLRLVDAEIGDRVLVHAGCAVNVVNKDTAAEMEEIFNELRELA